MTTIAWGKSTITILTIPINVNHIKPEEWYHIITKTTRAIDQVSSLTTTEKVDLTMYQFEFPLVRTEAKITVAVFNNLATVLLTMSNTCIRGADVTVIGNFTAAA